MAERSLPRAGGDLGADGILRVGALLLGALALLAIAGPWLAPHDPGASVDPAAAILLPPGARREMVRFADGTARLADRVARANGDVVLERLGRRETWPAAALDAAVPIERQVYWMGTDRLGRDVLSRLLMGGRYTLGVALSAAALSLALGLLLGALSGLGALDNAGRGRFGRFTAAAVDRVIEMFLAFPPLLLALVVAASTGRSLWAVIAVLAATSWMGTSRLVRGELRSLGERDFVVAARALGLPPWRVFTRHLLPHLWVPVRIDAVLRLADLAFAESALSFLGFGVQPPRASWGGLLADGRDEFLAAWWTTIPAGLLIAALALGAHLVAEGLRRRADPRHLSTP